MTQESETRIKELEYAVKNLEIAQEEARQQLIRHQDIVEFLNNGLQALQQKFDKIKVFD